MLKNFNYKAIIFDMDGTLYYQLPLKILMLFDIATFCFLHPRRIKDLFILKNFRKLREDKILSESKNFVTLQYDLIAKKFNLSPEIVKNIVDFWMHKKPLKYLKFCKDKKLAKIIEKLHKNGITIAIYSDYPAVSKAKTLNVTADYVFDSENTNIMCLKPDIKGIEYIKRVLNIEFSDMLIVGDRYEKDGKCAQNAGVDYIILPTNPIKRNEIYRNVVKSSNRRKYIYGNHKNTQF